MNDNKVSIKLLLKSGFWYTVSSFLTRAMAFITIPIFTRLMTKSEYGNFSVYATWQGILLIICGIEVYSTLNRARFDFPEKKELDGYITSSLMLSTVLTGILFLLYMVFPNIFARWFLLDRKYMMVMFAYLFAYPAFAMFQVKQRIEYKYKLSAGISFTLTIVSSLLALSLVLIVRSDRLFARIVGQYVLFILVGLVFYIYFIHVSRSVSTVYWKYALRIGLPMVFSYLASRILLASDTIVLKHLCSAEEVSCISVTHSVSHILIILVQTINTAWAPWFYDMLKIGENKTIKKAFSVYLWGTIICTFCVLLIGPEIIMVLGGTKYREAIYILPAYILSGIFTVLTAQFGSLETYYKKPVYAAILTGIAAILNVVLDIVGVNIWGYRAVCYVTVFCQILLICMHYFITEGMHIRELLSYKNMVLALCASLLLIPVSLILYKSDLLRYLFILSIAFAVILISVIKRKELIALIRRIKNGICLKRERNKNEDRDFVFRSGSAVSRNDERPL